MTDAYFIEAGHLTAGIAIRERGGYRFYASTAPFWDIDQRKFRRLQNIRTAVQKMLAPEEACEPAVAAPAAETAAPKFVDCLYA